MLRICNNCQQRKNNATGTNVNNPSGLTYKWFCQDCIIRKNENETERTKKLMDSINQTPISKRTRD